MMMPLAVEATVLALGIFEPLIDASGFRVVASTV
jgi:hypothetical protein